MTAPVRLAFAAAALVALTSACGTPGSHGTAKQPGIYGTDDRKEYFESGDDLMKQRLRMSTVAVIPAQMIDDGDSNDIKITADPVRLVYDTCSSERFSAQPAAAECSATLVDDDLVLTAGHCFQNARDCSELKLVFKYYYESAGTSATITSDDVFSCQRIVVRRLEDIGRDTSFDYAIIQLDRSATPRFEPAPVRRSPDPLAADDALALVSFPLGVPGKLTTGRVIDPVEVALGYFFATIDAYEGSSGGALYNSAGEVVGVLARGSEDFEDTGTCLRSTVFDDDGSEAIEEGSYVSTALDAFCALPVGQNNARLCGQAPADGGTTSPDGGQRDGGAVGRDGGGSGADGGASGDAGVRADGGTTRGTGGGCNVGGHPDMSAALVLLCALGLWFATRRRPSTRRARLNRQIDL